MGRDALGLIHVSRGSEAGLSCVDMCKVLLGEDNTGSHIYRLG